MNRTLQDQFLGIFEVGGAFSTACTLKDYRNGKIQIEKEYAEQLDKALKADRERLKQFIESSLEWKLLSPQKRGLYSKSVARGWPRPREAENGLVHVFYGLSESLRC
jgi:hypothetical protein